MAHLPRSGGRILEEGGLMAFRREDERSVGGGVQAVRSGDRRLRDRASVRGVRLEEAERGFAQPQEGTGVGARQIVEQPVAPVDGLAAFDDDRAVRTDAVLERRGIVLVERGEDAPQHRRKAFQRLGGRRCAVCRCRCAGAGFRRFRRAIHASLLSVRSICSIVRSFRSRIQTLRTKRPLGSRTGNDYNCGVLSMRDRVCASDAGSCL